jgi:hypothetical protein
VRNPASRPSLEPGSLTQQIRATVASGEFLKARLLWAEYGRQFRADIERGPLPQTRLAEARELYEWTRMVALCARAHAQAKLNQIAVARKYGSQEKPPQTTRVARF